MPILIFMVFLFHIYYICLFVQETQIRKIRARPYVHSGVNFEPKFEHRSTVAEPFSFDDRIKENQIKKEQKIQKLIDESTKVGEL